MFQFMPIIFTFMLASFPAGLVIYWSWNNLLSIAQQWLIMRRTQPGAAGARAHLTGRRGRAADSRRGGCCSPPSAGSCYARAAAGPVAAAGRPGGRVRRALQCRQVVAAECADRAARAGAGVGQPGRTRQLNFFDLGGRLTLVDMPGYGYARAGRAVKQDWQGMMFDYLRGRPTLRRVMLLLDARIEVKEADLAVMELLDRAAVTFQLC